MYVDSDHASEKFIRKSRTGSMIFMNNALIQCFSKRQPKIETYVFQADFTSIKSGIEILCGIR